MTETTHMRVCSMERKIGRVSNVWHGMERQKQRELLWQ